MGAQVSPRDIHFRSADGLALYGRDYPAESNSTPLLCLCGLTRNMRDFEPLAQWLGGSRRLIMMDYRGRGRSAYAENSATYRPDVELADALSLLDQLDISQVSVIGTSRGGIIAMLMAAKFSHRLRSVLLNDVGPVIEKVSLLRIASYLGKAVSFGNWGEAVAALKESNPGFDTLSDDEWMDFAKRVFIQKDGRIRNDYDLRLAETFSMPEDIEKSDVPDLWPFFDTLIPLPVTVLRGEHSDLLSAATVAEMKRRHPRLSAYTIKDRGHVPFLDEPEAKIAIQEWLTR
jgi:pimeloyl-ACP methyl ester carboxylesterase